MLTRRKRPTNAELLELARIQEELDALGEALDRARGKRQGAERRAQTVQARELEDWRRAMRESGRAHEIHKGKPVEPRSVERVEAERALAQAQAREADARRRLSRPRGRDVGVRQHVQAPHGEDQRHLIRLRGWPTNRYMKAVREDPNNPSRPRWSNDDMTAWEAARAKGGLA